MARRSSSGGGSLRPWLWMRLAQPLPQRLELAPLDLRVEVGELLAQHVPELRGDQVAQRVGGEVAEQPGAPVDVLEHALRVVRHVQAEQPVHALVPGVREVVHADACRP